MPPHLNGKNSTSAEKTGLSSVKGVVEYGVSLSLSTIIQLIMCFFNTKPRPFTDLPKNEKPAVLYAAGFSRFMALNVVLHPPDAGIECR